MVPREGAWQATLAAAGECCLFCSLQKKCYAIFPFCLYFEKAKIIFRFLLSVSEHRYQLMAVFHKSKFQKAEDTCLYMSPTACGRISQGLMERVISSLRAEISSDYLVLGPINHLMFSAILHARIILKLDIYHPLPRMYLPSFLNSRLSTYFSKTLYHLIFETSLLVPLQ